MIKIDLINLILLALNFCFFLATNWAMSAVVEYYKASQESYDDIKKLLEKMDEQYQEITEQHNDLWKQHETVIEQYKIMQQYFDSISGEQIEEKYESENK